MQDQLHRLRLLPSGTGMRGLRSDLQSPSPSVRRTLAAALLVAAAASLPSLAEQASSGFSVSVDHVAGASTCTASTSGTIPVVTCGPLVNPASTAPASGDTPTPVPAPVAATGGPSASPTSAGTATQGPQVSFRLPDTRIRVSEAHAILAEESFRAWGSYSSRIIVSDGVEYLEMTVSW